MLRMRTVPWEDRYPVPYYLWMLSVAEIVARMPALRMSEYVRSCSALMHRQAIVWHIDQRQRVQRVVIIW